METTISAKSENILLRQHPNYVNITTTFTGIGYVLLDLNSVIFDAVERYSLDIKELPSQTVISHFRYLISSITEFSSQDLRYFYELTGDIYFDNILLALISAVQRDSGISPSTYSAVNFSDEKIALALSSSNRSELNLFLLSTGLYVGILNNIKYELPFIFCSVYSPILNLDIKYKSDNPKNININSEININSDINEALEHYGFTVDSLNKEFENFEHSWSYEPLEHPLPSALLELLFSHNSAALGDASRFLYCDGRILTSRRYINATSSTMCSMEDLQTDKQWSGKDLELIMPVIQNTPNRFHLNNIMRSARSMYDGQFQYSRIICNKEEPKSKKVSKKMEKIIADNANRIRLEKEKADNLWLRGFFGNYSKLTNLKAKKEFIEKIKLDNDYITRKLSLLKIELYMDIWSLKRRGESIDERVLVPLYLECLAYLESYGLIKPTIFSTDENSTKENSIRETNNKETNKAVKENINSGELEFVFVKLIDAGFEATVHEIMQNNGLSMELPFKTKATASPNDIDLYFQLKYAGEHLKRTLGTRKDSRVPFDPDRWQIDLLDAVDSAKSAVVAAPTSSGKTFICFYAIEKILRDSNNEVVVFCLPTKALVNQVSADIYARFTPKNCRKSLQGTLMSDFSIEPFNCQVLITIPSMLESLLQNSPSLSKKPVSKDSKDFNAILSNVVENIRYLIVDEVHKINDPELGVSLERCIHMARCPILLLSATLGNLDSFYRWFKRIEESKGRECVLVEHRERFCELKPWLYAESCSADINDNKINENGINSINMNNDSNAEEWKLVPINYMFAYSHRHLKDYGFGNDIHFLPEDLLNLYYFIYIVLKEDQKKMIKKLAPKKFFKSNIICKRDIKDYERHLLATVEKWIKEGILSEEQVDEVHKMLLGEASHLKFINSAGNPLESIAPTEEYLARNILDLLFKLRNSNMLPVIIFNTDRELINRLAKRVYKELEKMDTERKRDKAMEKMKKESKRNRDAEKTKDSWIEDSITSEIMVEPETRDIKYTFLDPLTKLSDYEVDGELGNINNGVYRDMIYRGIGVHSDGMSRKYRSAMEILFRKKHVRVLFATETLALGINMPCRTVVFAGDSLELDPMNFKQMSGRAGRRGYDTLGNVVFYGMSAVRVKSLLTSNLPNVLGGYINSNSSYLYDGVSDSILENPLFSNRLISLSDSTDENNTTAVNENSNNILTSEFTNTNDSKNSRASDEDSNNDSAWKNKYTLGLGYRSSRQAFFKLQSYLYKFIHSKSYLWDLFVTCKNDDPGIFILGWLLHENKIDFEEKELMKLIAHLFEVREIFVGNANLEQKMGALSLSSYRLEQLKSSATLEAIKALNSIYRANLRQFYSNEMKSLDNMSREPLVYCRSFVYLIEREKNSYIYDFYLHGSPVKILNNNGIDEGQLWKSLNRVNFVIERLIGMMEMHYEKDDERLKVLRAVYKRFNDKFLEMFS
ncbi:ATP-dependent RNA helicase DDX60 [Enteropsectra breve]|nr:ATP-dependent RNA helicase DDX60 [Enteropsectra breve]